MQECRKLDQHRPRNLVGGYLESSQNDAPLHSSGSSGKLVGQAISRLAPAGGDGACSANRSSSCVGASGWPICCDKLDPSPLPASHTPPQCEDATGALVRRTLAQSQPFPLFYFPPRRLLWLEDVMGWASPACSPPKDRRKPVAAH